MSCTEPHMGRERTHMGESEASAQTTGKADKQHSTRWSDYDIPQWRLMPEPGELQDTVAAPAKVVPTETLSTEVSDSVKAEDKPTGQSVMLVGDADIEYEVDAILSERGSYDLREYLVKWVGYDSNWNTWEPAESLEECEALTRWEAGRVAHAAGGAADSAGCTAYLRAPRRARRRAALRNQDASRIIEHGFVEVAALLDSEVRLFTLHAHGHGRRYQASGQCAHADRPALPMTPRRPCEAAFRHCEDACH